MSCLNQESSHDRAIQVHSTTHSCHLFSHTTHSAESDSDLLKNITRLLSVTKIPVQYLYIIYTNPLNLLKYCYDTFIRSDYRAFGAH